MKRLFSVLFFVAIFLNFTAYSAFAQTPATQPPPQIPARTNADVPLDMGTRTQIVLIEIMAAMTCHLAGIDPINPTGKCLGVDPETNKIGYVENGGGAIGVMSAMIAGSFNIPINSDSYIKYTASNFGIAKGTYAQEAGIGFNSLNPLLNTWVAFRNIVYVLFVIIFMLIGFGIIFRFKVDPRTVMTIQNAIPRAIIVLVLVTFSFAISGFLIDLMYLIMYMFYEIIAGIPGVHIAGLNPTNLQGSTPFGAAGGLGGIGSIAKHSASSIGDIIATVFEGNAGQTIATIVLGVIGAGLGSVVPVGGNILGGVIGSSLGLALGGLFGNNIMGYIGSFIAFFIIMVAILFSLFRLWILLLKAYLFILIDTVLAPIWIAGSLIPGSPLSAGSWFKHIFSYIAVFPVTLFMFLLGSVFVQVFSQGGTNYFTPPLIGNPINPTHFGALIGLAIILMTPEVVNIVKDALHAPTVKYQAAIGQAFGMGSSVVSKSVSPITSRAWERDPRTGESKGFIADPIRRRMDQRIQRDNNGNIIRGQWTSRARNFLFRNPSPRS